MKCFRKALKSDPDCLMAHWGIAYACGPFYNLPWRDLGAKEAEAVTALAFTHIGLACRRFDRATRVERRLVEALSRRYQKPHAVPPEEFDRWDDDYAAEMRRVHYEFPNDHDVMALFAEALITRTPRRCCGTSGPAYRHMIRTWSRGCSVIERSIALSDATGRPHHPAIVHMHIHALNVQSPQDASGFGRHPSGHCVRTPASATCRATSMSCVATTVEGLAGKREGHHSHNDGSRRLRGVIQFLHHGALSRSSS